MDQKKINFGAPLLSARRYPSPLRSSPREEPNKEDYDSLPESKNTTVPSRQQPHLKQHEVVKPGFVPFHWEHIPGRAKGGSRIHSPEAEDEEEETQSTTRLPSGKYFDSHHSRISGLKSGESTNSHRTDHKLSGELNLIRPQGKFSGELTREQYRLSSLLNTNEAAIRSDPLTGGFITKGGDYQSETERDEDNDTDFSDALESFSMNCSTTGFSSSDNRGFRPSYEAPSSDAESRNFMINRFLPAAKAMTLESPQHTSKKQLVVVQQPPISKAIIPKIVREISPSPPPTLQTRLSMPISLYKDHQDTRFQPSEDDEDDRSVELEKNNSMTVKSCGFFPWFCSKNPLRLLNPVPAMKVKTKNALASASKVGRTLVKSAGYRSPMRSFSKHVHKVGSVTKSCELHPVETRPNGFKPRPMFYSGELYTRNSDLQARTGLSPYRNYRSSVSPCRNKSPHHSPFHQSAGFLSVPKRVDQPNNYESKSSGKYSSLSGPIFSHPKTGQSLTGPGSPTIEKTLYVDYSSMTNSHQSSERIDILKARGKRMPLVCRTLDANPPTSLHHGLAKKSYSPGRLRLPLDQHKLVNPIKDMVLRSEDLALKSPVPPPLPKSPSESWLSRNLNSVSPRNSFSYSNGGAARLQTRNKSPAKTPPPSLGGIKWETMVRSSYLGCHHGRYPEDMVAQVGPKQSRTRK